MSNVSVFATNGTNDGSPAGRTAGDWRLFATAVVTARALLSLSLSCATQGAQSPTLASLQSFIRLSLSSPQTEQTLSDSCLRGGIGCEIAFLDKDWVYCGQSYADRQ